MNNSTLSEQQQQQQHYFQEHLGVISALEENFSRPVEEQEDFHMIQAIYDAYDHMKDVMGQKEANVRDIVRQLQLEQEELRRSVAYPREEGEHGRVMERLQREKDVSVSEVGGLEAQLDALEEERRCVGERVLQLEAAWERVAGMMEREEPRLRNLISLYINVTKITWDLSTLSRNDDTGGSMMIKGTIDNPEAGVLEDVVVVPNKVGDSFDAVNDVWMKMT
jgi:hypothetical protein